MENIICNLISNIILYIASKIIKASANPKNALLRSCIMSFFLTSIFILSAYFADISSLLIRENIRLTLKEYLNFAEYSIFSNIFGLVFTYIISTVTFYIILRRVDISRNAIAAIIGTIICSLIYAAGFIIEPILITITLGDDFFAEVSNFIFILAQDNKMCFITALIGLSLPTGVLTSFSILSSTELVQKMKIGAIISPIIITFYDSIRIIINKSLIFNPTHHTLTIISNIVGGSITGIIVACLIHTVVPKSLTNHRPHHE